jgi:hypothetical protein
MGSERQHFVSHHGVEGRHLLDGRRDGFRVAVKPRDERPEPREGALEQSELQQHVRRDGFRMVALHLEEPVSAVPEVRLGVHADPFIDQDQPAPRPGQSHQLAPSERLKDPIDGPQGLLALLRDEREVDLLEPLLERRLGKAVHGGAGGAASQGKLVAVPRERRVDRLPDRHPDLVLLGDLAGVGRTNDLVGRNRPDGRHAGPRGPRPSAYSRANGPTTVASTSARRRWS